jgi:hypothetical protein
MTVNEFSNTFDTIVDSYRRFKDFDKREMLDSIEFDEYEKSVFLTLAQSEVVIGLYTGKNTYGEPFETTEELRRYLDSLVKTETPDESLTGNPESVSATSVFYTLPNDIAFIVYEQVNLVDSNLGCYDGSITNVLPVTHDEYNRIRRNPFRGATKYKVLRLDAGEGKVELVSKYHINGYTIRYLAKPEPIILEKLEDGLEIESKHTAQTCQLNDMLHRPILNRAVQLALASKGIQVN